MKIVIYFCLFAVAVTVDVLVMPDYSSHLLEGFLIGWLIGEVRRQR